MAIAYVKQIGTDQDNVLDATLVITVPVAGVASGNTVVVCIASDDAVPTGVTDTAGNTYNLITHNKSANSVFGGIAYAYMASGLSSGNTITVTWAGSTRPKNAVAHEFSGVANAVADTSINTATGFSTAPAAGSITTTNADDLLIGAFAILGDTTPPTITKDTNYTEDTNSLNQAVARDVLAHMEHRIVAATGSYNDTLSLSASKNWSAAHVALKAATSGSTFTFTPTANGVTTFSATVNKTAQVSPTFNGSDVFTASVVATRRVQPTFNGSDTFTASVVKTFLLHPTFSGQDTFSVTLTGGSQSVTTIDHPNYTARFIIHHSF